MASIKTKVINKTEFLIDLYEEHEGMRMHLQKLQPNVGKDEYYTLTLPSKTTYRVYRLKDPYKAAVKSSSGSTLDSTFLKENNCKAITIEYDGQACVWSATPS